MVKTTESTEPHETTYDDQRTTTVDELRMVPLSDFLIVQVNEDAPGLVIPGAVRQDLPKAGLVLEAGPGYISHSGTLVPNPVKKGDLVLLQIGAGTDVKLNGVPYRFVPARDLFAVFRRET